MAFTISATPHISSGTCDYIAMAWSGMGDSPSYLYFIRNGATVYSLLNPSSSGSFNDFSLVTDTEYSYYATTTLPETSNTVTATPRSLHPPTLSSVTFGGSSMTFTWGYTGSTPTSLTLYRQVDGGSWGAYTGSGTPDPAHASYEDTGVTAGHIYGYKMTATLSGGYGTSGDSNTVSGTFPLVTPTIGTASRSGGTVTIPWSYSGVTLDHFNVYRSVNSGAYSVLSTASSGASSYDDTALTLGYTVAYKVGAVKGGFTETVSGASNTLTMPTLTAPTIGTSTRSGATVTVNWTPQGSTYDSQQVHRSLNGAGYSLLQNVSGTATSASDTSFSQGDTVAYKVLGTITGFGNSSLSGASNTITIPTLTAPAIGTSTRSGATVTVNWTPQGSTYASQQVYKSLNGGGYSLYANMSGTATSTTDTTFSQGDTVAYKVLGSITGFGDSALSSASNTLTIPTLTAPIIGTSTRSGATVTVSWTPQGSAYDSESVYKSVNGGGYSLYQNLSGNSTSTTDTTFSQGDTVAYKVLGSITGFGDSSLSAASNTLTIPTNTAPTIGTASRTLSVITIPWTRIGSVPDYWNIYRALDGGAYSAISTASAGAASYDDGSVPAQHTATYKVGSIISGFGETVSSASNSVYMPTVYNDTYTDGISLTESYSDRALFVDSPADSVTSGEPYTDQAGMVSTQTDAITTTDATLDSASLRTDFAYYWGDVLGGVYKYDLSVFSDAGAAIVSSWLSKTVDFVEQDVDNTGNWKCLRRIEYLYRDWGAVPVSISVSVNGGASWETSTKMIGGYSDGRTEHAHFHFIKTGQFFIFKVQWPSATANFQFLGMDIVYDLNGSQFEIT